MTTELQLMTADELLAMPDDGFTYELIKGETQVSPPPGHEHGLVTMNIAGPLYEFVKANGLGKVFAAETGFLLEENPGTVRAPDVAFVTSDRIEKAGRVVGYWKGAPDLAVEVTSPNDIVAKVEDKVCQWLAAGTRQVWVVSPMLRTVTIFRSSTDVLALTEKDVIHGNDLLPGFQIYVRQLFE